MIAATSFKGNGAMKCSLSVSMWAGELGRCKTETTYHPGGHTELAKHPVASKWHGITHPGFLPHFLQSGKTKSGTESCTPTPWPELTYSPYSSPLGPICTPSGQSVQEPSRLPCSSAKQEGHIERGYNTGV